MSLTLNLPLKEAILKGDKETALDILDQQYKEYQRKMGMEVFGYFKQTKNIEVLLEWIVCYNGKEEKDVMISIFEYTIQNNYKELFQRICLVVDFGTNENYPNIILGLIFNYKEEQLFKIFKIVFGGFYTEDQLKNLNLSAQLAFMEE